MAALLKSRKFLILCLDAFFATVSTMLTIWLSPENVAFILGVVAIWQPVVYAVIKGITEEDVAAYDAFSHPNQVNLPKPSEE
jgi:hypothetical protein